MSADANESVQMISKREKIEQNQVDLIQSENNV